MQQKFGTEGRRKFGTKAIVQRNNAPSKTLTGICPYVLIKTSECFFFFSWLTNENRQQIHVYTPLQVSENKNINNTREKKKIRALAHINKMCWRWKKPAHCQSKKTVSLYVFNMLVFWMYIGILDSNYMISYGHSLFFSERLWWDVEKKHWGCLWIHTSGFRSVCISLQQSAETKMNFNSQNESSA